jgi:hypothetical protein
MSRYSLNLPNDLKREAEEYAQKRGVSLNQFILWSVAEKVGQLRQALDDPTFPEITYNRGGLRCANASRARHPDSRADSGDSRPTVEDERPRDCQRLWIGQVRWLSEWRNE